MTADGEEVSWGSVPTPWHPVPTGAEIGPVGNPRCGGPSCKHGARAGPAWARGRPGRDEHGRDGGAPGPQTAKPVAPAIAWHDTRGEEETADLVRAFERQTFSGRTGLAPSPFCTLVKLAWRSRHQGSAATRALSVADWVVHALGRGAGVRSFTGVPHRCALTGRAEAGGWKGSNGRVCHQTCSRPLSRPANSWGT